MTTIRSTGTLLTIAATRHVTAQGAFTSGKLTEAAAALVTGTLAILFWLRSRQSFTHHLPTPPFDAPTIPTSSPPPAPIPSFPSPPASISSPLPRSPINPDSSRAPPPTPPCAAWRPPFSSA